MRTVSWENERGNIVAGKDVKGIQVVLVPDDVQEEAHSDEVVVYINQDREQRSSSVCTCC